VSARFDSGGRTPKATFHSRFATSEGGEEGAFDNKGERACVGGEASVAVVDFQVYGELKSKEQQKEGGASGKHRSCSQHTTNQRARLLV